MKIKDITGVLKNRFMPLLVVVTLALTISGCTKNFEKYNLNNTGIPDSKLDSAALSSAYVSIESNIFHNYQTSQNLSSDEFSGFMMTPTSFAAAFDMNYTLNHNNWDQNGFNDMYNYVYAPILKISRSSLKKSSPDFWAIALLLKVETFDRVTDKFGPIPYSKVGSAITSVSYDSQQSVYNQFFLELDTAVNNLTAYVQAHPGATPFQTYDLFYNGDYTKWIKFANSLRLRLALHISKIDPATAKLQGEKALATNNFLSTPADDFAVKVINGQADINQINGWGDNRFGAALASYLIGFKDPRLPVYASPATAPASVAGTYTAIRIGLDLSTFSYKNYASLNNNTFTQTKAEQLMCAAEVWFLKAEAAVRGWANAGNAQTNYETGISTSMTQWGASIGNYVNDGTSTEAAYVDPQNAANNSPALSTITIKWDAGASNEQMLERIITQKWLAIFPEGMEAWTEFRRTGYPKLFPVVNNTSNGLISTSIQIRRLTFPPSEYTSNQPAMAGAVQLLGGPDNGGTRLWWDVNKGNF